MRPGDTLRKVRNLQRKAAAQGDRRHEDLDAQLDEMQRLLADHIADDKRHTGKS